MTIRCAKCGAEHHSQSAANFEYRFVSATEQELLSCSACKEPEEPQVVCNKCELSVAQSQAKELFDVRKNSPTGFQYSCKKCRLEQTRRYRARLSGKQKEHLLERERRRKHKRNEAASVRKRDHAKRMQSYGELIIKDEPLGNSARTFNFALKLLLEKQFDLYYDDIKSITGQQRKRQVIGDALFEFKDILTRVNNRMKVISESEPKSSLDNALEGINGKRIEALLVLGLPGTATDEEIKGRYKRLAREAHPDHGGNAEKMAELNAAMSTLEE